MDLDNILSAVLCTLAIILNTYNVIRCRSNPYNFLRVVSIVASVVTLIPEVIHIVTGTSYYQWFSYAILMLTFTIASQAIIRVVDKGNEKCP